MTILFKSDWQLYPTAIVDYQTTNKSFLKVVDTFQRMGVDNCLFPLSLLQPELQGIDPFSEDLTEEQKVKIGMECRYNYWYYVREIARFRSKAGPEPIRYRANRANIAMAWSFLNHIDFALIQPRQTGKSGSIDQLLDWLMCFGASNTLINLATLTDRRRNTNIDDLKSIRDLYPSFLFTLTREDSDNKQGLTYKKLGNHLGTAVSQTSIAGADRVGRGLSSAIQYFDELAYLDNLDTMLPASLAAAGEARDQAAAGDQPYGNIYATTAGKKDSVSGRYAYEMITNGAPWTERFYDAPDQHTLSQMVIKNSALAGEYAAIPLINGTFNHRQLGRTDAWLRQKIAESRGSGDKVSRDYLNQWTSGTESSPLTVEQNERVLNSEIEPLYHEIAKHSYMIRWYVESDHLGQLMIDGEIVLGIDFSDALGRDAIAMTFLSSVDLSVVAAATVNETNLIVFAHFLSDLMARYPKIVMIPERNRAQAMIDSLLIDLPRKGIDPFKRIYNTVINNKDEKPKDYAEVTTRGLNGRDSTFYERWKHSFGFNTTNSTRQDLYHEIFQNAIKEAGHLIHDKTLSAEIRGLVIKNGRVDHSPGSHDDHVIAWLIANWFLTRGKNLAYYGINTSQLLSRVHYEGRKLTPEEEWEMEKQNRIRSEIESLYEQLRTESDIYVVAQIEARLTTLSTQVSESTADAISIDALIQQAADERRKNYQQRAMAQRRQNMERRQTVVGRRQW